MLILQFFKWWYSDGWINQFGKFVAGAKNITEVFSVKILLSTMFNPWKQIISKSFSDNSLDEKMKAILDNLVSRTIGFFVRLITLFVAAVAVVATSIVRIAVAVIWPILPVLPIILLIGALAELVS